MTRAAATGSNAACHRCQDAVSAIRIRSMVSARLHQASESRPTEYPDGIPFIPNEPVSALSVANTVTLMWFKPTRVDIQFVVCSADNPQPASRRASPGTRDNHRV